MTARWRRIWSAKDERKMRENAQPNPARSAGPSVRPLTATCAVNVSYSLRLVDITPSEATLPGDRPSAHRRLILVGAKAYFPWDLRRLLEPDPSARFVLPNLPTPLWRNRTFSELTYFFGTDVLFRN